MTIVSSVVSEDVIRKDGRRNIIERHTDHLGIAHAVRYMAEEGQDTAPLLAQHATQIARSLRDNELEQARDSLEDGVDPSTVTVEHSTRNQMRRFQRDWCYRGGNRTCDAHYRARPGRLPTASPRRRA